MEFCKFSMYNILCLVIVLYGVFGAQNSQLMNDKAALLSFMSGIVSDPGHVLQNWNSSGVHVCNWARVRCNNESDSVTELILNATWLSGTISPSLANLSSLTILDLSRNFFKGPIPKELGSLSRLRQLSLSGNFLEGKIPYHLGFLQNMVYLDLGSNKLQGEIPESLFCNGSLSLKYIDLSNNSLSGEIPLKNECGLKELWFLLLWSNRLVGHVPRALSNSTQLKWLDLESNMLTGELPSEIVLEMPRLQILYLSYNSFVSHDGIVSDPGHVLQNWNSSGVHVCNWARVRCNNESDSVTELILNATWLSGTISPSLANLSSLTILDLSRNFFKGPIPKELGSLSRLRQLSLSGNFLEGKIPYHLGFLQNMVYLDLGSNKLQGEIPESLFCNGSLSLKYIDLSNNSLSGEIPLKNECGLKELWFLLLWSNRLVGHVPRALSNSTQLKWLDLESNMLTGELPSEIVLEMPRLQILYLSYNSFVSHDGNNNLEPFFASLGNCSDLRELELAGNNLRGKIPPIIGDLSTNLVQLHLDENLFYGFIPPHISNLVNLTLLNLSKILDLSHNKISGVIPSEVAGLRSLKLYLNLSSNHLYGPLPLELSKMDMVLAIDLSNNNLSGTIPTQLKSCIALESLNLSRNILEGPLPFSVGQLPYLKALDVSLNQLIGGIPQSLQMSSTLKHVNFSFNKFSGNVSNEGAFSLLTIDSFLGNDGLCGSIEGMPKCSNRHSHLMLILSILLSLLAIPIVCIFGYRLVQRSRIKSQLEIFNGGDLQEEEQERKELKHPRISYGQLIEATGGFSASSLIGSGQFGHVYKGVLHDNTRIAVKVLDTKSAIETPWSFKRECQVLKRTRHRNLIRIITICSRPDFKALVLPLMCTPSVMPKEYTKIWRDMGKLEFHLYRRKRPTESIHLGNYLGAIKTWISLQLFRISSICSCCETVKLHSSFCAYHWVYLTIH
ncbi:putative leucine-rich repeat receptor-like serine/threonine-protein kinase [Quercus suber]|uniref:Leucine-rich repeat receptor-like serine/threonine-protein kinase n=1 Tax=Quercus suber TaxID=58331 RepID=A0AAW0LMG3_QUESU